jgi:hypothetical protein
LGTSRAFISQEGAILEPNDLAGTEEGKGLERLAQAREDLQGFAAIGDIAVEDFVIRATDFIGPLLVQLPGSLFYRKFVFAAD